MAIKKIKFNIDGAEDVEPSEAGNFYDGPVPPKGVYRVRLKFLRMKTNKNDDPMLNGILEIEEKGDKAKYNGYGIWFNQNVTKQGTPYVNNFLDAFGFSRKAFWGVGPSIDTADADENNNVIGTIVKIGTKRCEDIVCKVRTKRGKWDGEDRLEVAGTGFLSLSDADGDDDEDAWSEDADDTDDTDESGEEEAEEEDEQVEEIEEDLWTAESLGEFGREELVPLAREYEIRVLKRHTKDDLIDLILEAQADDVGSDDDEEEEDGEPPF